MESMTILTPSAGIASAAMASVKRNNDLRPLPLDSLYLVPLSLIRAVEQPRSDFSGIEELAAQIAEERGLKGGISGTGFLQALLLRPDALGVHYLIVAGERRFKAAESLGLPNVPAFIETMSPADAWRSAIVENVQRKQLSGMEEGIAYRTWKENEGLSDIEIARAIGKSVSYVTEKIGMLSQPDDLREMITVNPNTARAARDLKVLSIDERRPFVEQFKLGASYNSLKPEIENARARRQARARQSQMESETTVPVEAPNLARLPRIGYGLLVQRMEDSVEQSIDVCRDVPPIREKKREMLAAIERLRARLDHLEEII